MNYTVYLGVLSSLDLDFQEWIFTSVILFFVFAGFSAYISLNRSYFSKNDKTNKNKILILISAFIGTFLLLGLVGLIVFVLMHFIMISFISDYRLDDK